MPHRQRPLATPSARPLSIDLQIALLCLVWSSTWWAIRVSLRDLPPLTAAATRFLLAGAAMVPLVRWLGRREAGTPPPAWLWLTLGTTNFAGSYGILYWTEQTVPSGIAAVLWAVFPVLMAIAGVTVLGERLSPRQLLGFGVAFAGVVTMYLGDLGGDRSDVLPHAFLLLLSPVVSAVGTVLVKRFGSQHGSLVLNRNGMLFGAALLAIAALAFERDATANWTGTAIAATLYLALVGTSLTFGLYFWLLRRAPASRLSLISYVTPILALLLGYAVGDGTLDLATLFGAACIAAGIALVVVRSRPRAVPAAPREQVR